MKADSLAELVKMAARLRLARVPGGLSLIRPLPSSANNLMSMKPANESALRGGTELARLHQRA
jgi:hypothetical protein